MRPFTFLSRGTAFAALLIAPLVVLAEPASATPAPSPDCVASTCTVTMDQPGAYEWVPPAYLAGTNGHIDLYGASGGSSQGRAGGLGGQFSTSLPFVVSTFNFVVGGEGSDCPSCGGTGQGGSNGGGDGSGALGAGGGGSSDVRANGGAVRFISAGGGGGAGGSTGATGGTGGPGGDGGAGGGAGGNVGATTGSGQADGSDAVLGGGGGSGYSGGAGAPAGTDGGGGGGYSGAVPVVTPFTTTPGVNSGDGRIVITYEALDPSDFSVSLAVPSSPVPRGVPTTITATVTPAPPGGTVRFYESRDAEGQTAELACAAAPVDPATGRATCDVIVRGAVRQYYAAQYLTPDGRGGVPSTWKWMTAEGVGTAVGIRDVAGPLIAGRSTTFTADVTPSDVAGRVQFYVDDVEVDAPVDVDAGVATSPPTTLSVGTHRIRARFGATATHNSSHAEIEVTVGAPEFGLPDSVPDPDGELGGVPEGVDRFVDVDLVASGYAPGAKVVFGIYSKPQQLATATADASGVARSTVTVPDLAEGSHTFVSVGSTVSGRVRYLTARTELIAVGGIDAGPLHSDDPNAPNAPIDLADTGFHGLGLAGLAVLALVTGGFVLVATRRRDELA